VTCQAAPGANQQPEPLIQTVTDLAGRHRRHPRGRQLDRQRDPVQAAADLHHRVRLVSVGQQEARSHAARAFDEQRCGSRVDACPGVQRRHQPQLLVGDPQSLAAGGQDPHGRRLREDGLDEIGCGLPDVFAVVDHQQPDPAFQRGGHRLADALARLLGDAQHPCHGVGHRRRIGHRRQLEKPDAVRKFIGQPRRDLGRQASLADPTHPGQRDEPMGAQRRLHVGDFGLAPDEAGGLRAQVSRSHIQCSQRRKVRAQAGCSDLKHPHRGG
jgi:hypothetical protein